VSKTTYERLKAYCETNGLSMSQFVEQRVGDFLGRSDRTSRRAADEATHDADPRRTADHIFSF
jgi:hypothetical protein